MIPEVESGQSRRRVGPGPSFHAWSLVAAAVVAAWAWIVVMARDMYGPMTGASAWMMTMRWDGPHLVLLWLMWAVMMAGMMLPSAAPLLRIHGGMAQARQARTTTPVLAGGYLAAWAGFSVAATAAQRAMTATGVLSPMMEPASARVGGVLLLVAGAYQLTPLKQACLRRCRSPLGFLMSHWRPGAAGAFRLGAAHGAYCVGCCWALMLLLFAGGVMNLAVIAALTVFVAFEKLGPFGARGAWTSGLLLAGVGLWMLAR